MFFQAFRGRLAESTSVDFVVDEDPDLPRPQNYVTVARTGRLRGEGRVLYKLSWDALVLEDFSRKAPRAHIDAYIILFETNAPEQFTAINEHKMDRVLELCRDDSWGPKKAIMLGAHHGDPFMQQIAYTVDDLRALMRRSHAMFRRGNFAVPTQCADAVDLLVVFLISIHSTHDLSSPRPQPQAPAESSLHVLGDALVSFYQLSLSWRSRLFPTCLPAGDPDRPLVWTDEERAVHSPVPGQGYTPMGAYVGGYQ